ncbi:hypothetical protein ACFQ6N_19390 [Kitasatospora sp. NPDC056446]|uniref:hypothetical protein n=1 Tax=Kitasatospora sp. NPDC056446 TaxID=3345819 RepID=UPI0036814566
MAQLRSSGPSVPWVPRLLLLVALLFGVVTMHTLGHPVGGHGDSHGSGHEGSSSRVVAVQPPPGHHGMPAGQVRAEPVRAASAGPTFADLTSVDPVSAVPVSADGMDPMAVCLAVLVGWTLLLLVAGPLLRRSGDAAAEVRARLLRAVRALPPPGGGRILLNRLSVLRQ